MIGGLLVKPNAKINGHAITCPAFNVVKDPRAQELGEVPKVCQEWRPSKNIFLKLKPKRFVEGTSRCETSNYF